MAQITWGLRKVLEMPQVYNLSQFLAGGHRWLKDYVNNYVKIKKNGYLLDIGCGTGLILNHLDTSINYYGYDISKKYIEYAQNKYINRGIFKNEILDETKLKNLPLFDVITINGVLHHLNDDEVKNMYELSLKALRPGGKLISIDPVYTQPQNKIARLIINGDRGQNVRTIEHYFSLSHDKFSNKSYEIKHRKWIPYTHIIMSHFK